MQPLCSVNSLLCGGTLLAVFSSVKGAEGRALQSTTGAHTVDSYDLRSLRTKSHCEPEAWLLGNYPGSFPQASGHSIPLTRPTEPCFMCAFA